MPSWAGAFHAEASTITHDAKLHGLKFWPIDVQHSEWNCTLEALNESDRSRHSDPLQCAMGSDALKDCGRRLAMPLLRQ